MHHIQAIFYMHAGMKFIQNYHNEHIKFNFGVRCAHCACILYFAFCSVATDISAVKSSY